MPLRPENLRESGATDDVFWLAFRYAQDELSADEAEAFEERLATEQPIREALAEATRLAETIGVSLDRELASQPSTRVASRSRRRTVSWAAASAAACLALLLAWGVFRQGSNGTDLVNDDPAPEAPSAQLLLAQAYSSGIDAWPILREEVAEPEVLPEGEAEESFPVNFDNDWIALAVIAAHGSQNDKTN
jgi:hypothetical protein